jgi:Ni/Co efflux regulator RcnB
MSLRQDVQISENKSRRTMKKYWLTFVAAAALIALSGTTKAQERGGHTQFDDHDQQVARDWYKEHRDHPPAGFRDNDRLSSDEESRLREGEVLDRNLRKKVHSAPHDLTRRLPPPPRNHRYVAIGGHVGLVDDKNRVKAVIHLHD